MTFAKKAVCVMLTLLMLMSCMVINVFAADGGSFTVKSSPSEVNPGDTVTVTVNLDKAMEAVGGLEFNLTYDATALKVTGATKGSFLDVTINKNNPGYVVFSATANDEGSGDNLPASAVLMTVEFTVEDGASGNISVGMNMKNYFDIDFADYDYTVNPATITIKGAACDHSSAAKEAGQAATHTVAGFKDSWYCKDCDKYFADEACTAEIGDATAYATWKDEGGAGYIDAQGHTYGDWQKDDDKHWKECGCGNKINEAAHTMTVTSTTPATCTTDGSEISTCSACGYTKNETIPATDHNWDTKWTSDGTNHWHKCLNAGCTEKNSEAACSGGKAATCQAKAVCSVCEKAYGELADHDYDTAWTSGDDGHWHECKNCDAKTAIENHSGGNATCTEKAKCLICEAEYGEKADHDFTSSDYQQDGENGHKVKCKNCDAYGDTVAHTFDKTNCAEKATCTACGYEREAGKHIWGDLIVDMQPGCASEGHGHKVCESCSAQSEDIPIEAKGHEYKAPQFSWSSNYKSCDAKFYCKNCSEMHTEKCNVTSETTPSTCKDAGKTVYTATAIFKEYNNGEECKDTKEDTLPLAEHTFGNEVLEVPATCTENGTKAHFECSVCDKLFVLDGEKYVEVSAEDLVIPATDHDWTDWNVTKEASCTEEGSQTRVCKNDRTHVETEAIAKLPHDYKDGICTVCGAKEPVNPVDPVNPTDNTPTTNNTPADPTKPATGDAGVGVWVALLTVSALFGTAIVVKKRHA